MRAMILAAGRGERMGDLTTHTPKPLLRVGKYYLIEHAIFQLKKAGIQEIVINVCYLGEQIKKALGQGERYEVKIYYSEEKERLETGGGIYQALPLLGEAPFLVVSADIITDYDYRQLPKTPKGLAHLILVDNPSFNPRGDFGLVGEMLSQAKKPYLTFASIGVYTPQFFSRAELKPFPLNQLLFPAIERKQITGEYFQGTWFNVGTKEELIKANDCLKNK